MKNRTELSKYFQDHYQTGLGVEVGVQNGFFSRDILKDWKGVLKCVDIWTNQENFQSAMEILGADRMIKGKSVDVAKTFEDGSLDFVYIDADHSYEAVKEDYNAWLPKVRKGGVIAGHDYGENDCIGVKQFIDEISKDQFQFTTGDFWNNCEYQSWYKEV